MNTTRYLCIIIIKQNNQLKQTIMNAKTKDILKSAYLIASIILIIALVAISI